jgi:outer membrane protein assembly factor BamB
MMSARSLRHLAAVVALIGLTGCQTIGGWFSDDDSLPPAELVAFDASLSVDNVWSKRVVGDFGRSRSAIAPVFADEWVWVAGEQGQVVGVNALSGRVEKRFETDLSISAGPLIVDEHIVVGTFEGQVVVMDKQSGEVVWRREVSSEVLASPIVADDKVVVRVLDGRVYGFDRDTGRRAWVYDRSVPLLTLRGNSAPVARAGRIYLGFDDGVVASIRADDGTQVWEQRISEPEGRTELERLTDIDGPMAIVGNTLYVVTYKGRMAAVATESGRLLWIKDISAEQGLSLRRTQLAVADREDAVWLVDRQNSATLWREPRLERRDITRPVFYNNHIITVDFDGYMHWLDTDSGEFVARPRIGSDPAHAAPLVVGNTAFVLDTGGRLTAWQARP